MPQLVYDENEIRETIDRIVDRTFRMDFGWDWPGGVAFYGVCEAFEATGNGQYMELLQQWVDEKLEDGLPKLSVNGVSIGHSLITLYKSTGDSKYLDIAVRMADYLLHDAERFGDDVLQHTVNSEKDVFPEQAWVDTMMMAGYFLLRMGRLLDRSDYRDFGLKQYHGHEELLQDPVTNLYYHGWDNVAKNHMSAVYWARGNAWAALTMARALREIEVQHPSYMIIEGSLRDQLSALVRLQSDEGLWHTVLNDKESYLETSASAGIAASLFAFGTLYNKYIQKSIGGLLKQVTADGAVLNVSAGTAVMHDTEGYKNVSRKRIQGWGQGLALAFFAELLQSKNRVYH
ncbi:glycoside hydrolase family 88 protein [Paenibacillus cisolokensis]|uniref:glycoside hydrolase family 88/105 protein n=1 Tax=Paenibacillus cisolokensis TaxID=1658519 RepID=UPI003D279321